MRETLGSEIHIVPKSMGLINRITKKGIVSFPSKPWAVLAREDGNVFYFPLALVSGENWALLKSVSS